MKVSILIASVAFLAACHLARAADFVPFVIPATQSEKSLIAFPSHPIEPNAPRLVARDGRFFLGDGPKAPRVRIWGVNLCFAANFPTHADAERLAARLAAFGINSVRFHHMDSQSFPRGIWDAKDANRLSAEALDRLDYLIDQLARRGVWSNINLHVSRTHSRFLRLPDTSGLESFDKMVDIFTPQLVDAQKKYARDLLTHVNPYRKMRLADDPAVAFVEINNEDSLFMWGWENKLRRLPEFYGKILQGLYNSWLLKRYESKDALAKAWSAGAQPLGDHVLEPLYLRVSDSNQTPGKWDLELHASAKATAAEENYIDGVRIEIDRIDDVSWHIQFRQFGFALKAGEYYTLFFCARAEKERDVSVGIGQHESPWSNLGLSQNIKLGPEEKAFRFGFKAKADEKNARLSFSVGQSTVPVELGHIDLRPGGRYGLCKPEDPKAGTVTLFGRGPEPRENKHDETIAEAEKAVTIARFGGGETDARTLDRMRFLAETEKAYFDGMRNFIKKDLGCKALVTGTIVFGPLGLWAQSDMDFIDGHAYWQHPRFPRKPWDPADWTVEQKAMVDHPDQSTLYHLAAQRLAGKPYTVSEYNHPAPNDYQAECVPMIASFAAAQDWDGIWLFAYNHSADWDRQAYAGFFDIDANPAKWGFVPAGAAIFRCPGESHLMEGRRIVPLASSTPPLVDLARLHLAHGSNLAAAVDASVRAAAWRNDRVGVSLAGEGRPCPAPGESQSAWSWEPVESNSPRFRLIVIDENLLVSAGHLAATRKAHEFFWFFRCDQPEFAAMTVTPMDGKVILASSRLLVTACGRCENTGMQFTPDRRSVGRNWGKAPVLIEPVEGVLELPFITTRAEWKCHALKPDGTAGEEVPINAAVDKDGKAGTPTITLSGKYGTMWYLLQRN